MKITEVSLPNGLVVSCFQKHEVPIVNLEVHGYLSNGIELKAGDTVFDVGAHIGLFTLAAYEHCGRDLNVYSFEPVPDVFEMLRLNAARHDSGDQLKVFPFGLSSSSGSVPMAYYPQTTVLSTIYPDENEDLELLKGATLDNVRFLDEAPWMLRCLRWMPRSLLGPILHYPLKWGLRAKTIRCEVRTVSQVIREHAVDRVDLLKVDAERAEHEILKGIDAGDWPKIRQIVADVHDLDGRLEAITTMLRDQGLTGIVVEQPATIRNSNIYTVYAVRPAA